MQALFHVDFDGAGVGEQPMTETVTVRSALRHGVTMPKTCGVCEHWVQTPSESNAGSCYRYPPLPLMGIDITKERNSQVHMHMRPNNIYGTERACGEFKDRENSDA